MTKHELEAFRQQLLVLRRRLLNGVGALSKETFHKDDGTTTDNLSNIPVEDRAELGSDINCQDTTIGLLENECVEQAEVDAALDRMGEGGFGNCEACGKAIAIDRLQAIPFARQCIDCAGKARRELGPQGNL